MSEEHKKDDDDDERAVDLIRRYLAEKLGFYSEAKDEKKEEIKVNLFF